MTMMTGPLGGFDSESDPGRLRAEFSRVMGAVGVQGVLALIHDKLDTNPGRYASYAVMQRELRRFSRELDVILREVEHSIDLEVDDELSQERSQQYALINLCDREGL